MSHALRWRAGTAAPSHKNTGNTIDVTRPIDNMPPADIGGSTFRMMNTA